ncbi:hypothetical protein MHK_006795, partial [Candidatus Magnetomorum sp. HK-1]
FNIIKYDVAIYDVNHNVIKGTQQSHNLEAKDYAQEIKIMHDYSPKVYLNNGKYNIMMKVEDELEDVIERKVSVAVIPLYKSEFLVAPNPINPNIEILNCTYFLDKDSDVQLRIYSISGELLYKKQYYKGDIGGIAAGNGLNVITWDGRNRYNEIVANGVYLGYLVINNESGEKVKKVKIAVLK